MGIYQKLGVRKIAIYVLESITWIRMYGLRNGLSIYSGLSRKKNGAFRIQTSLFKNPVLLRDNISDKAIFRQVFYDRQYDLENIFTVKGDRIIDAGANVGYAALYFDRIYAGSRIIAIEPDTNNFELLQKNVSQYPNVTPLKAAIWNRNEGVSIANPDSLAASFMIEKADSNTIPGMTIDRILEEQGWQGVDIVKMDIEGAEKEVFSEGADWLRKTRLLIIELHDRYKPDCTKTFFRALEPYEYTAHFQHENIFILFNHDVP